MNDPRFTALSQQKLISCSGHIRSTCPSSIGSSPPRDPLPGTKLPSIVGLSVFNTYLQSCLEAGLHSSQLKGKLEGVAGDVSWAWPAGGTHRVTTVLWPEPSQWPHLAKEAGKSRTSIVYHLSSKYSYERIILPLNFSPGI